MSWGTRVVFCMALAGCAASPQQDPATLPIDLFRRDQPQIRRIITWDGKVVAQTDEFYAVDVAQRSVALIRIPGLDSIIQLAMHRNDVPLALGRTQKKLALLERREGIWTPLDLPEEVQSGPTPPLLLADDSQIILFSTARTYRIGRNRTVEKFNLSLPRELEDLYGDPQHAILRKDTLYLGWDRGEWGGGLASLDLQQGLWTVVGKTFPVRELKIDSAGKLWAVEALHHLGTVSGLRVFDGRSWDVFAFTEMDRPEKTKNWPLPSGPFQSVAFTTAGEVFVLVDGHGIARWNQKEWRYVTKGWPRYKFMGEPYPLFANSFCLAGSIAVVSMYDAGLALWDLKSNDVTRLTLR